MILLAGFLIILQSVAQVGPMAGQVSREAWVMGTRLSIVIDSSRDVSFAREASEAALSEIERMDGVLSNWDPSSEVSRLNAARPGLWASATRELTELLSQVLVWADRTQGAFDPTVGALIAAWDLRGVGRIPADGRLSEILEGVGPDRLVVDMSRGVTRRFGTTLLDTGGFGKGAALRSAGKMLTEWGIERAMLDLGGQLLTVGPAEDPWVVQVAHPSDRQRPVLCLELGSGSVATSGNSERRVEIEGRVFGHILDPRTGRPAPTWGSVTVVAADALEADILSTALYVMGPTDGMRWVRTNLPDLAVLFLDDRGEHLRASWTPSFGKRITDASDPIINVDSKDQGLDP